jgi:V/A-type H+/Na+-transporting ATPase subunit D
MAKLNVNPTRMELTGLKRRRATAVRGHKLLKDKQDELMRQFIDLIRENNETRRAVEEALMEAYRDFGLARAIMSSTLLEAAIMIPRSRVQLDIKRKNIMSVNIPVMSVHHQKLASNEAFDLPYGFVSTTPALDIAVEKLTALLPLLLHLAEVEKACQLMADEIEKTRRRVNALEYTTIPQLQETIRYIKMKLDENERGNTIRLMKIKEMLYQARNQ